MDAMPPGDLVRAPGAKALGVLRAELLKLRKRPANWIIAVALVTGVVLLGYVLNYTVIGSDLPGVDDHEVLRGLLPALVVPTSLSQLAQLGGPVALILAALAVGSEYSWGTYKPLTIQGPGRVAVVVGKLGALAVALGAMAVSVLLASWAASLLVAGPQGESLAGPPLGELVGGLAAAWLMLAAFAALGAVLAFAFRGTALAIGLGLMYFFVIEIMLPLPAGLIEVIEPAMLGPNVIALSAAFGVSPVAPYAVLGELPSATRSVAVLSTYVVVLSVVGLLLFRRRSID